MLASVVPSTVLSPGCSPPWPLGASPEPCASGGCPPSPAPLPVASGGCPPSPAPCEELLSEDASAFVTKIPFILLNQL